MCFPGVNSARVCGLLVKGGQKVALTDAARQQVMVLRGRGASYGAIALEMGLSRNTVKSICQRAGITPQSATATVTACQECGAELAEPVAGRRFCSSSCRMAWWHAHPEKIERRAVYTFTCQTCGIGFEAYGNNHRKYCSRACYQKARAARLNV